jgi:hypothetical protein
MEKDEESSELKERISKLSDGELLNIVEVDPQAYRKEALDYAKAELIERNLQFQEFRETSDEEGDSIISKSAVMRKLFTCKNTAEAGLLKGLLSASGIACEIRGEYLSMASGELPFAECYPELWLMGDEELERAREILNEWQSKEVGEQKNWTCQRCGEENEGQFSACWSCGRVEIGNNDPFPA